MRSLFQEQPSQRGIGRTAWLSITLHGLLLAGIVAGSIHVRRTVVFAPMTRGSSQIAVVAVSRGALAAVLAAKSPAIPEKTQSPRTTAARHLTPLRTKSVAPSQSLQPSRLLIGQSSSGKSNPGVTGQGSDAQSMYPAYPTVSPSPQVADRSLLPETTRKIVVDVNLGADGHVQQATLVAGLGNALDQLVLDTVHAWQFQPAMVNGQPVPSSIELVFPFDRNYPQAD